MSKDIHLDNGSILTDNSEEVLSALTGQMAAALEAIGLQAEGYAKALAPVDTGRLRNSITHTITGAGEITRSYSDDGTQGVKRTFGQTIGSAANTKPTAFIGTNVEYAAAQELGVPSRNIKGHHYLKRAVTNNKHEYILIAYKYLEGK